MPRLSESQINAVLRALPGWNQNPSGIEKTFKFKTFAQAMTFVNTVAEMAETVDHHPDIDIRYNEVTLALWTHSEGGITEKDAVFAEKADELIWNETDSV